MKIYLVTSSRSDFTLYKNLIFEINRCSKFELKILVTGSHLSKKHGNSFREILNNKLKIYKKIFVSNNTNFPVNIIKDMNIISYKVAKIIEKKRPDLFIVLGDRYEILAATISAYIAKVPVVHIHGGEVTQGSLDDGYRHSITKLSSIHFVAHSLYKKRLIQLGENPKNVFNVGGLGAENTYKTILLNKKDLEKKLNLIFKSKSLIICLQPEITYSLTISLVKETLQALKLVKDTTLIFTMPGSDLYNNIIFDLIKKFVIKNKNSYYFKSLGGIKFLSCLNCVDGIIGNSSSGILEMPTFKKGTINIGNRQNGRIKSVSVINTPIKKDNIIKSINFLYSEKFKKKLKRSKNPYFNGLTSKKILFILKKLNLKKIINKKFYDL